MADKGMMEALSSYLKEFGYLSHSHNLLHGESRKRKSHPKVAY